MPGCVVDFGHGKKEKVAGKSCPLFENIYLYFARFDDKI